MKEDNFTCCEGCEDTCGEDHGCHNRDCSCHKPTEKKCCACKRERGTVRVPCECPCHQFPTPKDVALGRMKEMFDEEDSRAMNINQLIEEKIVRDFQEATAGMRVDFPTALPAMDNFLRDALTEVAKAACEAMKVGEVPLVGTDDYTRGLTEGCDAARTELLRRKREFLNEL